MYLCTLVNVSVPRGAREQPHLTTRGQRHVGVSRPQWTYHSTAHLLALCLPPAHREYPSEVRHKHTERKMGEKTRETSERKGNRSLRVPKRSTEKSQGVSKPTPVSEKVEGKQRGNEAEVARAGEKTINFASF